MKALIANGNNYGPFNSIETLEDRYRCDNTDLPFVVVGQGEIVEADTIDWPAPPLPPVVVPQSVSMRQAELALLGADLLDDIEALVATLPRAAQIEWRRASTVERSHPLIAVMQTATGMTDAQLDDLIIAASNL